MNKSVFAAKGRVRRLSLCLAAVLVCSSLSLLFPIKVKADYEIRKNRFIEVNGEKLGELATLDYYYDNALYVSLRGFAYALRNTDKAFSVSISSDVVSFTTGKKSENPGSCWSEEEMAEGIRANLVRSEMYLNDKKISYPAIQAKINGETSDCFMALVDLAMIFDLHIDQKDGIILVDTSKGFAITPSEMEETGYLQGVNAFLIGDGSTGEIWYRYEADENFAIASTTKLMTYLIIKEAISKGEISLSDKAVIPVEAEKLSRSSDGVVPMSAGEEVSVSELITGMLVVSSNECALTLATHVAGTEEAFVEKMNAMAKYLELPNTQFYNCHGLPIYEEQLLPAKMQNQMSADDMFTLASYIVTKYPEIYEITSIKETSLPTLEKDIKNGNFLLYNMDEVKGLKTGTTTKSGACLVSALPLEKDGEVHNMLIVLFGAEGSVERIRVSEIAARYVLSVFDGMDVGTSDETTIEEVPEDVDYLVRRLLRKKVG